MGKIREGRWVCQHCGEVALGSEGAQRKLSVSAKGYLAASQGDILARKNIWGHIVGYEIPD